MSSVKVRGGRTMDVSYDTDGGEGMTDVGGVGQRSQTTVSAGRACSKLTTGGIGLRRNLSFRGSASVDNYQPLPVDDDFSTNMSLDRRDKHRNPIQKAMVGFKNIIRNISHSSPSLPHTKRSPNGKRHDVTVNSELPRRVRTNSVSQISFDLSTTMTGSSSLSLANGRTTANNFTLPNGSHPGVIGIHNHGNTCFINAVIQCLSNTDLLVEHLLGDEIRDQLDRCGVLTEQFLLLIMSLWTCSYTADISFRFKQILGDYAEQYSGSAQNDSQEFLLWLLDKINEELNESKVNEAKLKESGDSIKENNNNKGSIIFDLFQAKYRSTLTCPSCHRQSDTYDPFLSVSLPIQQKNRLPVYVIVVYLKPYHYQVHFGLMMNSSDCVYQLRRLLAEKTEIHEKLIVLTQIYDSSFQTDLEDEYLLQDLSSTDFIYAIEMCNRSSEAESSSNGINGHFISGSEFILIIALNTIADSSRFSKRFGGPFVVRVSRDSSVLGLRAALLSGMESMLPHGLTDKVVTESCFHMRIVVDRINDIYIDETDELPLYAVSVDKALSLCNSNSGPSHIKLLLEWSYPAYKSLLINTHPEITLDKSYKEIRDMSCQTNVSDLHECFSAFTQQEQLDADDAPWECPNCHKRQQGTIKALRLCSLPDVMVVHLKRFKQEGENRMKLNSMIKFPINGLDMTCHMIQGHRAKINQHEMAIKDGDYVYDLYAVCNHDGNMMQGHYRAICKNPLNGRWYLYDDSKVNEVKEEKIVSKTAYLLFYKRRKAPSRSRITLEELIKRLLTASRDCHKENSYKLNQNSSNPVSSSAARYNHVNDFSSGKNGFFIPPPTSVHPLNTSFHASLHKSRKIITSQSALDALAISTPKAPRASMTHSKSQPLPKSSTLVTVIPPPNEKLKKTKDDKSDAGNCCSDASTLLDTSSKINKPIKNHLVFEKVSIDTYRKKRSFSFGVQQIKLEKFLQESSV